LNVPCLAHVVTNDSDEDFVEDQQMSDVVEPDVGILEWNLRRYEDRSTAQSQQ
jgi:hypothetical protein